MLPRRVRGCATLRRACRRALGLLLLAAVGLGVLPLSVGPGVLPPGGESACRFEPIDVCGAGDASLGMLADTPVLVAAEVAVAAHPLVLPAPPGPPAVPREGFAPGVYRPPRPSC